MVQLTREQAEEINRFTQTGEATEDFMAWLESCPTVMRAIEQRFRSDDLGRMLTNALAEEKKD